MFAKRRREADLVQDAARLQRELVEVRVELESSRAVVRRLRRRVRSLEAEQLENLPQHVADVARAVRAEHLTLLGAGPLAELARAALEVEDARRPGIVMECGTARGGSAIVLAAAKSPDRPLFVHDVFGLIPPPTDRDGDDVHERYATIVAGRAEGHGGETYYGYRDELYDEVTESFVRQGFPPAASNVHLVRGLFQDTILGEEPVALAHLDGDWYESTRTCLERIAPRLVTGGRLVVDDYQAWSGCRSAVDEYLARDPGLEREMHSRLHLVRR
ncbi:TylF/MycF/NovP-related O-methyltransferase [Isoptericola jiangsuensis]|uniref:TylF/MycF/NovP-related O-methyltransferase n=1 Tax=Isoptericola jiangsuensis TaxID=548579 RepID=UPI003AB10554